MNERSKRFVTILLYAVTMGVAACASTPNTQRMQPRSEVLEQHGISPGQTVLLRYFDDAEGLIHVSSRWDKIVVKDLSKSLIYGFDEGVEVVDPEYDDLVLGEAKRGTRKVLGKDEDAALRVVSKIVSVQPEN